MIYMNITNRTIRHARTARVSGGGSNKSTYLHCTANTRSGHQYKTHDNPKLNPNCNHNDHTRSLSRVWRWQRGRLLSSGQLNPNSDSSLKISPFVRLQLMRMQNKYIQAKFPKIGTALKDELTGRR